MKTKILFLISAIFISNLSQAQYVNIPDTDFVTWLNSNGYASCMSGNMMDTTGGAVVYASKVEIVSTIIGDLTGIQYFDNLDTLICEANWIANIPALPPTLLYLDCHTSFLTSLPALPGTLQYLSCWNNQLTSLPALPSSLLEIVCYSNSLTSLPALPSSLQKLNCFSNQLTSLPFLPSTLESVFCDRNQITSLPALPPNLEVLNCASNLLTFLPSLPNSLQDLLCRDNQLSSLPALPNTLTYLSCGDNLLTLLLPYPPNLVYLYCENNFLTSLPSGYPTSLHQLTCNGNQLTSLPAPFPLNLGSLDCSGNQLTSIPVLNQLLHHFKCANNPLTSYPTLPAGLGYFTCDSVLLPSLPVLPSSLQSLSCKYCPVNVLPDLPDTLYYLDISYTPVACLPHILRISNLLWTGANLNCLPNIMQIAFSTPSASVLSLCQPSGNCPVYWNIKGNVYNDVNADCINNAEDNLNYIPVKLDSAGTFVQEFFTNANGDYSFHTNTGTYTVSVDTANLPFNVTCPAGFSQTVVLTAGSPYDSLVDFALGCKPGFDLQANNISPCGMLRPGVQRTIYLDAGDAATFYGTSCTGGVSGTVVAVLSGPVNYASPAPGAVTPSNVTLNTITWNVSDFALSNPATDFNIIVAVPTSATIGDTICVQLSINPVAGDNNASNNILNTCYPVVNSLDPNEKYMSPSGNVDTLQHWFTFTVFFQNTGTAPAEDIYILDTLSSSLDASTFTFLSSSNDVITQLLPGNVLRFNYPDINLPDSTSNEPASHGYIQFKIKRKPNLPAGSVISNTAYIYFDYNPAIVTNTASATLTVPSAIKENTRDTFQILPNPANGRATVISPNLISEIKVISPLGKIIYEAKPHSKSFSINMEAEGIYFVAVTSGSETVTKKIIIQH